MSKNTDLNSHSINLIGVGTSISGEIKANGDIRIDGSVVGTVHSKGKVVIGSTGNVEGEIHCINADISGTLIGNITVAETLALKATANLKGDIITNKLAVDSGANFTGACSMGAVVKDMNNADREKAVKTA